MRNQELEGELADLSSAEEFFGFFGIWTDPHVVFVNRLHILQRFHDRLESDDSGPKGGESWWEYYARELTAAYQDFVTSDARTQKVFKVFRQEPPKPAFVPLEALLRRG